MGESPERDWNALLKPRTTEELRRQQRATARRTWRRRAWFAVIALVMGGIILGWLSLVPWALRPPGAWVFLSVAAWIVALPLLIGSAVAILAWLGKKVIPRQHQELELEA